MDGSVLVPGVLMEVGRNVAGVVVYGFARRPVPSDGGFLDRGVAALSFGAIATAFGVFFAWQWGERVRTPDALVLLGFVITATVRFPAKRTKTAKQIDHTSNANQVKRKTGTE